MLVIKSTCSLKLTPPNKEKFWDNPLKGKDMCTLSMERFLTVTCLINESCCYDNSLVVSSSSSESSCQLCCTIDATFFSYSRRFSLYNWAASLFAGLFGFGSWSKD